jgi:hypothetical protein
MLRGPHITRVLVPVFAAAALAAPPACIAQPSVVVPAHARGDTWTYREIDGYGQRRELGRWIAEVTEVGPDGERMTLRAAARGEVDERSLAAAGSISAGRISIQVPSGRFVPPLQLYPVPLAPGQRWSQETLRSDPTLGGNRPVRIEGRVVGWEKIRVPAGEFDALKIERVVYLGDAGRYRTQTRRYETEWYAPSVKAPVKLQVWEQWSDPTLTRMLQHILTNNRELYELVEYRAAG